jgi:hypothetical protein
MDRMRLRRALLLVIALMLLTAGLHAAGMLPSLSTETLSGKTFVIPRDLRSAPALFVIGFTKSSQEQTEGWTRRLRSDKAHPLRLPLHSVVDLEDVPRFFRGVLVRSLKSNIPARLQDDFLIVTQSSDVWKRIAGFAAKDDAYIVLVGSDGAVAWRTHGPVNDTAYAALQQAIVRAGAR